MWTHFMALSFLGLNSQTGEESRKLVDDSLLSSDFSFSSRPGRVPFFGKQPRTGSEQKGVQLVAQLDHLLFTAKITKK